MFWPALLASLTLTAATGAALGAALGLTGLIILHFFAGGATFLALDAVWNAFNSFTLSAIPLFIILGEILLQSGISRRVYTALTPAFQRVPGGLLHTNIAVCTVFGAVSGSSMSTAAAVGSVAYPEMARLGYHKPTVVGSLAGGGTLGLLIPPSLSLLIYGALTETSIGRLFMAGILPGLMMSGLFMAYIFLRCARDRSLYPGGGARVAPLSVLKGLLAVWPVVLLILAVMGSIVLGIATPTEAAGVGVAAAALISALWGDLTLKGLLASLHRSVLTYAAIGFVVMGAVVLAQSVAILGVPQALLETVRQSGLDAYSVLIIVVAIYVLLGCLFDGLSLMIMTLPIVFPLLTGLGFDAIWLGVLITIMIEIGQVTPPVGLNLSVLVAITEDEVGLGRAAVAAMPYWLLLLAGVVLLTLFPQLALVLPDLVF